MNCDFDEVGNCFLTRMYPKEELKYRYIYAHGMGCCNGCVEYKGYFHPHSSENDRCNEAKVKHLLMPVVGYWSPTGCVLKNDEKSDICREFKCYELRSKLNDGTTRRVL
jgi:hypothetical protein